MTNKYIDLTEEIWRADEGRTSFGSVSMVLAYLDEHPERAPGRTITESEMTDKYIDLTDRIEEGAEYSNTTSFCLGIECALRWLDDHPDQVPGPTVQAIEGAINE